MSRADKLPTSSVGAARRVNYIYKFPGSTKLNSTTSLTSVHDSHEVSRHFIFHVSPVLKQILSFFHS